MDERSKLGIVIVLLPILIAVFIAPAVDLEPTALRAMQAANMLLAALALARTAIAALLSLTFPSTGIIFKSHPVLQDTANIVDLTCARLC